MSQPPAMMYPMKLLQATDKTRGVPAGDFHGAQPGEIVVPVLADCHDPRCAVCSRAWVGLTSLGATSIAVVGERSGFTDAEARAAIEEYLEDAGIVDEIVQATEAGDFTYLGEPVADPVTAVAYLVDDHLRAVREITDKYPVGSVLSRLGPLVAERTTPLAA